MNETVNCCHKYVHYNATDGDLDFWSQFFTCVRVAAVCSSLWVRPPKLIAETAVWSRSTLLVNRNIHKACPTWSSRCGRCWKNLWSMCPEATMSELQHYAAAADGLHGYLSSNASSTKPTVNRYFAGCPKPHFEQLNNYGQKSKSLSVTLSITYQM